MRLKKKSNSIKPTEPSKEQLFVQYYLDNRGIKYKTEYRIDNLVGDVKLHRKVDFYLPKLNIYVEYCGWYNKSKKHRTDYDIKANVYFSNDMPSVFIYPHELGFLDYALHNKILKVLRLSKFKKNRKTKIFRYKLSRYLSIGKGYFLFISLVLFILSVGFIFQVDESKFNIILFTEGLIVSLFFMFLFFRNLVMFFYYDK